jgi:hypothetical protein
MTALPQLPTVIKKMPVDARLAKAMQNSQELQKSLNQSMDSTDQKGVYYKQGKKHTILQK